MTNVFYGYPIQFKDHSTLRRFAVDAVLNSSLAKKASRYVNIRGGDQPLTGGLMMAVYRISEPVRTSFGKDKNGWNITRLVADYQCDCGTVFSMQCRSEKSTKSCGCFAKETARKLLSGNQHRKTHDLSNSETYKSWSGMKARCENPNHIEYPRYGGRGIKVCESWLSFDNFLYDMGIRPEGCSIERIDNDGNYELRNCRWATNKEQARNRRNSRMLTIDGVTQTVVEWSEQAGASKATNIYRRLDLGWSDNEAVFGRESVCKN
jgi:hypothetical protein